MIKDRTRAILKLLVERDRPVFTPDFHDIEGVHVGNAHSYLKTMAARGWCKVVPLGPSRFRQYEITPLGKVVLFFSDAERDYFDNREE